MCVYHAQQVINEAWISRQGHYNSQQGNWSPPLDSFHQNVKFLSENPGAAGPISPLVSPLCDILSVKIDPQHGFQYNRRKYQHNDDYKIPPRNSVPEFWCDCSCHCNRSNNHIHPGIGHFKALQQTKQIEKGTGTKIVKTSLESTCKGQYNHEQTNIAGF
ncbi:noncompact myelin-associated protein isoform X2 [Carcharodon carcharias]|uniref:noncompact myelin-associated protein isoform X2 n=1 Tax=Carcharodon carcharias TaxID=13397 RepID=UPI001B7DEBD6|nr:noncompact myelin-associated protein isoform X2 [Carcharodon carcharias]